ncbi:hypothetical protein NE237_002219 [Protea cynaroides]|uniref:Uncharacterized protein n=1 Tax=Protea cynaroides TaxID=273540 RepID=A0A9Q0QYV1_9MAGN|nr:hypothetical protein NE237_002219 [Protea cynaroides]
MSWRYYRWRLIASGTIAGYYCWLLLTLLLAIIVGYYCWLLLLAIIVGYYWNYYWLWLAITSTIVDYYWLLLTLLPSIAGYYWLLLAIIVGYYWHYCWLLLALLLAIIAGYYWHYFWLLLTITGTIAGYCWLLLPLLLDIAGYYCLLLQAILLAIASYYWGYQRGPTMPTPGTSDPAKLKGKYAALVLCWILGIGNLLSWNSMLAMEDYYMMLFPKYHPSRVLTLVYQPFSFGMISILTYHEAKLNTRKRNLFGYTLFFISSLTVLILDLASSGKGGIGHYIGVCVISVCFGVASALVEGGMVGDLSSMSPKMMQSYVAGMAASATLTSALRLITKVAFSGSREGLHKGACM